MITLYLGQLLAFKEYTNLQKFYNVIRITSYANKVKQLYIFLLLNSSDKLGSSNLKNF